MFNVFSYDRQMSKTQQMERMKDRFVKDELRRRKTQDKMSNNYKKRVENFVLQMAEKPLVNHDFVPPVVKIRDEEPSKFLGSPSIIISSFKHEKDRIKENIENYKKFQMEYTGIPFEFRKRDASREIQPMMRFTSKTNFEKVANRLKILMENPNQDARALAKGAENLSDSFILELSKSPQATNKYLAKHLLPELNAKTHFKATQSLYLALPDTLLDKESAAARASSEKLLKKFKDAEAASARIGGGSKFVGSKGDLDLSEIQPFKRDTLPPIKHVTIAIKLDETEDKLQKELDKQVHIEIVNPADVSKKVLMKCNIIRNKKEGSKSLPKGGGHLMSMSERSLRQIYQDVYHKQYY